MMYMAGRKVFLGGVSLACRRQHTPSAALALHETFLSDVAKVSKPPRLNTLLEMLSLQGDELVNPRDRAGLNPFLVPVAKTAKDGSLLCYIRWPTQREEMPLQLVRTTECGVKLVSLDTNHFCHRIAAELDFESHPSAAKAIDIANKQSHLYNAGDFNILLKSGKFPTATPEDLQLVLDRFMLMKVGAFPDSYERLANNFAAQGNDVSALVTCERSVSLFYSWGHPMYFHTKMLERLGRGKEVTEAARSCMGVPKWTIAESESVRLISTSNKLGFICN
jgi:hypothetical protein